MSPPPPRSTLFPYTTLFRSFERDLAAQGVVDVSGLRQNELRLEYRFGHSLWRLPQAHHQSQHVIIERFAAHLGWTDRKSTRLNSSHTVISYAVFCLKKKKTK